jgi:hypothetical protein
MALGDYTKTAYANGTTPAINATNLNNNENKTKEIDTALVMSEVSIVVLKRKIYIGVI